MIDKFINLLKNNKKRTVILCIFLFALFKTYNFINHKFFTKKVDNANKNITVVNVINGDNYGIIAGYGNFSSGHKIEIVAEASSDVEQIIINGHAKVKKGDLIMILNDRTITSSYENAKYTHKNAEASYIAAQEMLAKNLISQSELHNAQAEYEMAITGLKRTTYAKDNIEIRAPFDGTLVDVFVSEGRYVLGKESQAGQTQLYSIIKDDKLSIEIPIQGKYINNIKKNQKVDIICDYGEFSGYISRFENIIDMKTGYFVLSIKPNDTKNIINGSSCAVKIPYKVSQSFVIPSDSLTINQETVGVKVIKDKKVEFRVIKIISDEGGKMIVSGIENEDLLIINGGDNLKIGDIVDPSINIIKND